MVEITRTIDQWWATARRLDQRYPGYPEAAQRIREKIQITRCVPLDITPTVGFTVEEAAVVLARAPLSAWWMPAPPVSVIPPLEIAFAEAEEIIRAILRMSLPRPQPIAAPGNV